ncbi:MAG: O-methyltransferase [Clostridiales bacterium]|nr:O-methyltransferase [Clostridiales bacterium]
MIVDEHIVGYINSMEIDLPDYLRELEEQALKDEVPIIRKEAQTLLKFFLEMKQPKEILEVGAAVGFSSSFMSEYMPKDCRITTIEKVEMRLVEAKKNLPNARRAKDITLMMGEAMDALRMLNGEPQETEVTIFYPGENEVPLAKKYDFIFMDAAKAQYMNFLPEIMKLLADGGLFITDNVLQEGSIAKSKYSITRRDRTIHVRMREYLYTLTHMPEFQTMILPVGDGVAVSILKKEAAND